MITLNSKRQRLKRMERFGNYVFQFCGLKTLAFAVLAFSLQPLAFVSRVSDQLRNPVNQFQILPSQKCHFPRTASFLVATKYDTIVDYIVATEIS
jgi:hypothetical protein